MGAVVVLRLTSPLRTSLLLGVLAVAGSVASGPAYAQQDGPPQNSNGDTAGPPPMEGRRPPMERAFHFGPPGRWWNNPTFAKDLNLTADQQKKMEAVFEDNRPKLTDMFGALRKEESNMGPLLSADQPDESRILAQIDRVAQARAELEKANARMLLGLRRVLTQDQWQKLQAEDPGRHGHYGPAFHHGGGNPDYNGGANGAPSNPPPS